MNAVNELKEMDLNQKREKYKNVPEYALPKTKIKTSTSNELTQAIIKYLTLKGHFATRVSSAGRYLTREKIYIPSTTRKGTADIHAIVNGKHLSIEVKIGKDKLSEAQKTMKQNIERAGGAYFVSRDFDSFVEFYKTLIEK